MMMGGLSSTTPDRTTMAQPDASSLPLLNVYEIVQDGVTRHLICFLDPILAGARGIEDHMVLGDFQPGPDGGFTPETFRLNPAFVETFTTYMNEVPIHSPAIVAEAALHRSEWLYVLDPRRTSDDDGEPPASDLIGCYAVDDSSQIVPGSFQYNANHRWFDDESGVSGVLSDRKFYDWMHPAPERCS
jgi:hypothetical protein